MNEQPTRPSETTVQETTHADLGMVEEFEIAEEADSMAEQKNLSNSA